MADLSDLTTLQTLCSYGRTRFEFFTVSIKMTDLTFLPMLYIWTDDSILSYVKMLS